jgi:hypothetical protein
MTPRVFSHVGTRNGSTSMGDSPARGAVLLTGLTSDLSRLQYRRAQSATRSPSQVWSPGAAGRVDPATGHPPRASPHPSRFRLGDCRTLRARGAHGSPAAPRAAIRHRPGATLSQPRPDCGGSPGDSERARGVRRAHGSRAGLPGVRRRAGPGGPRGGDTGPAPGWGDRPGDAEAVDHPPSAGPGVASFSASSLLHSVDHPGRGHKAGASTAWATRPIVMNPAHKRVRQGTERVF